MVTSEVWMKEGGGLEEASLNEIVVLTVTVKLGGTGPRASLSLRSVEPGVRGSWLFRPAVFHGDDFIC